MKKILRKSESGSGLIEIIISITVLGFILISLFPFLMTSIGMSVDNGSKAEAIQVANGQINLARNMLSGQHCDPAVVPNMNIVASSVDIKSTTLVCPTSSTDKMGTATYTVKMSQKITGNTILTSTALIRVVIND